MGYRAGVLQIRSPCRIPQFFSPGWGLHPDQEQVDGLLEPEDQGVREKQNWTVGAAVVFREEG